MCVYTKCKNIYKYIAIACIALLTYILLSVQCFLFLFFHTLSVSSAMGGGGTAFRADQIGHRIGRGRSGYSAKEIRDNMSAFKETGVHPELERAFDTPATSTPMPESDARRSHVRFDFDGRSGSGSGSGSVVIEIFETEVGRIAENFVSACTSTASTKHCTSYRGYTLDQCRRHRFVSFAEKTTKPKTTTTKPVEREGEKEEIDRGVHVRYTNARGAVSVSSSGVIYISLDADEPCPGIIVGRVLHHNLALLDGLHVRDEHHLYIAECGLTPAPGHQGASSSQDKTQTKSRPALLPRVDVSASVEAGLRASVHHQQAMKPQASTSTWTSRSVLGKRKPAIAAWHAQSESDSESESDD